MPTSTIYAVLTRTVLYLLDSLGLRIHRAVVAPCRMHIISASTRTMYSWCLYVCNIYGCVFFCLAGLVGLVGLIGRVALGGGHAPRP